MKTAQLLPALSLALTTLCFSGCYTDGTPPAGSAYEAAYSQREAETAYHSLNHAIDYKPVAKSYRSAYTHVPPTSLLVTSEEHEPRLNVTGDRHSFLFGAFEYSDY